MVKQFLHFYWLVIKKCFEGAFLVADGFGLVFLLISKSQPNVPIQISLAIFGIIFLVSVFAVWRDEVEKGSKLKRKLDKIKEDIPVYELSTGALESYSIENIITRYSNKLKAVETKLAQRQPTVESSDSGIAALVKSISNLSVLPTGITVESTEEEADRLARHVDALKDYQEKMLHTYKVPIYFESSRSDNNVEFQVEAPPGAELFVKDDYAKNELPRTNVPSRYGMGVIPNHILASGVANANRLYPYSYAEGDKAYSKITKINANRKYNLFDEDFYIETKESTVTLTVTIHSEKLQKRQVVKITVELKGATVETLSQTSSKNA